MPTSVSTYGPFTNIVPVNNKTLWLLSLGSLVNRFIGYYDFDPNTGILTKMMLSSVSGSYPLINNYNPLIISAGKALAFMGDSFNTYQLDGVMIYSIVALPVLSVQTILINDSIFIAVIAIIIWFTEIKILSKRIGTYLDNKFFS